MEIVAQAVIGISRFLHPDYMSASSRPPDKTFVIDFSDGIVSTGEILLTVFSIAGAIIFLILLANFISFLIKRSQY